MIECCGRVAHHLSGRYVSIGNFMNRNEKFKIGNDPTLPLDIKVSKLYSGSQVTRALIAGVPWIGTYIDNVLTERAQVFTQKRLEVYPLSLKILDFR